MRGLVLRLGGPRSEAEDLVQEVFLVAHRKWPGLGELGQVDPRNWLYRSRGPGTALRVAATEASGPSSSSEKTLHEPKELHETPATLLERSEERTTVHRLLGSLSEKKRVVFVLFEIEGLPGQQIADILQVPLRTVWTRLFHARRAFLKALAREELREQRGAGEADHG